MLGLLLIYFIGKYFYNLAEEHHKSKWGYAILGVVSYYLGTILAGIAFAIIFELWGSTSIDQMSEIALNFMALPFGILMCVGLYYFLKKRWEKSIHIEADIIDEIGASESQTPEL